MMRQSLLETKNKISLAELQILDEFKKLLQEQESFILELKDHIKEMTLLNEEYSKSATAIQYLLKYEKIEKYERFKAYDKGLQRIDQLEKCLLEEKKLEHKRLAEKLQKLELAYERKLKEMEAHSKRQGHILELKKTLERIKALAWSRRIIEGQKRKFSELDEESTVKRIEQRKRLEMDETFAVERFERKLSETDEESKVEKLQLMKPSETDRDTVEETEELMQTSDTDDETRFEELKSLFQKLENLFSDIERIKNGL